MKLYDVFMTLEDGEECWWQGYATSKDNAYELAWDYAITDYNSEPITDTVEVIEL